MAGPPTIPFTPHGPEVTRVGLGGEGVLRTFGRESEARVVIQEALSLGVTYFDTAPAYSGSQGYLGSIWAEQPEARKAVFHTSKSAGRTYAEAMQDLERTLETLRTDTLDLWQIHDVRTPDDVRRIEAEDGALKAFVRAREEGTVGRIGVTGHHDPEVLETCVRRWPLDSVLLPSNPAETVLGGFLDRVVLEAEDRGMAVIGMKCLGGGQYVQPESGVSVDRLLRYALHATGAHLIIVGCSSPAEVRSLVQAAQRGPLQEDDRIELERLFTPRASMLAFYRGGRM
ncbi:MAG: aldo/keto reductase [Deltaproteobacteria bacterium]|nr:aldo/keto reductase [Deltaproteobacteria bacterium]